MKKRLFAVLFLLLILFAVSGCGSSTTTNSSNRDWKQDAYEQGYYKGADGKWYHKLNIKKVKIVLTFLFD